MTREEYFTPPKMCTSPGGLYDYQCKYHAKMTGWVSVCLYHKQWKKILLGYKCPDTSKEGFQ
jgi:hypothetical protein